jgi:hypothetical protein
MASTIAWTHKTVFGNKRVWMGTMTATDGTDAVATGLHRLDHAQVTQLVATNQSAVTINVSANGAVALTSGTSGGTYHLMVVGN